MERSAIEERNGNTKLREESGQAVAAVARAREAINLRLLLELRRRLKMAAERELAVGADRMRRLRAELLRGEAELRLFGRALHTRSGQLLQMAASLEGTEARASHTCARLAALEHEHQDLAEQLSRAEQEAVALQRSVRSARPNRHGTLDALVLAAQALTNDLAYAARDQALLRARGSDLLSEGHVVAVRAGALRECFEALGTAVRALCDDMSVAADGLLASRRQAHEGGATLERREAQITR